MAALVVQEGEVKMILGLIIGTFIGSALGVCVMALIASGRDKG